MNPNQVRAKLREQGLSLAQFSKAHGYEARTVSQTLQRWAGAKKMPYGLIASAIIRDLSRQINAEIITGSLNAFASKDTAKPTKSNQTDTQAHD